MIKIIFEKYKIDNKIFATDFDNASSNIVVISSLTILCNPFYFVVYFSSKIKLSCFKYVFKVN